MSLPIDATLNKYSLEYKYSELCEATQNFAPDQRLGSGSFGVVYRGIQHDGTDVAVKALDVKESSGFMEECRVLSKFRHPNLVILMGFARNGASRYLVYEFCAGGDVYHRLKKCTLGQRAFDWEQRIGVAFDAACGLSHLHNSSPKVFHRDIKSPNILLDKNGNAKMADFGLAFLSNFAAHRVRETTGTIGYADPLYIQSGIVTEGSEVYSFGMVLLELLTAEAPAKEVRKPDGRKGYAYLSSKINNSKPVAISMADKNAQWPMHAAGAFVDIAFSCIQTAEYKRPNFRTVVNSLRSLRDSPQPASNVAINVERCSERSGSRTPLSRARTPADLSPVSPFRISSVQGSPAKTPADLSPSSPFRISSAQGSSTPRLAGGYPRASTPMMNTRGSSTPCTPGRRSARAQGHGLDDALDLARQRLAMARSESQPRTPVRPPRPAQVQRQISRPACEEVKEELPALRPLQASSGSELWSLDLISTCNQDISRPCEQVIRHLPDSSMQHNIPALDVGRLVQVDFFQGLIGSSSLFDSISRQHFHIWAEPETAECSRSSTKRKCKFFVTNDSSNGTIINNEYLKGRGEQMQIHHGDVIALPRTLPDVNGTQICSLVNFSFNLSESILCDVDAEVAEEEESVPSDKTALKEKTDIPSNQEENMPSDKTALQEKTDIPSNPETDRPMPVQSAGEQPAHNVAESFEPEKSVPADVEEFLPVFTLEAGGTSIRDDQKTSDHTITHSCSTLCESSCVVLGRLEQAGYWRSLLHRKAYEMLSRRHLKFETHGSIAQGNLTITVENVAAHKDVYIYSGVEHLEAQYAKVLTTNQQHTLRHGDIVVINPCLDCSLWLLYSDAVNSKQCNEAAVMHSFRIAAKSLLGGA